MNLIASKVKESNWQDSFNDTLLLKSFRRKDYNDIERRGRVACILKNLIRKCIAENYEPQI